MLNRITFVALVFYCSIPLAGCSRSDNGDLAKAKPASHSLGWDLQVTDAKGQVMRLKRADFQSGVAYTTGTQSWKHGGIPVKIGSGESTIKWELIKQFEITPVAAVVAFPHQCKATVTLKDGKTMDVVPNFFECRLLGQTDIGDYSITQRDVRIILVLGPSK